MVEVPDLENHESATPLFLFYAVNTVKKKI